ncbi:DNA-deoxyinosine glycosylase [Tolumonas lignilytica]|uniref:DNA-deoxyinosine glycosylase n=1 Tax=Tolumonas lignilytica TaxID=1283284 RepID=UPI000463526F|nr:DNA-deoxyinosine glycosylase [Tolumonas lignilytica]
MDLLYSFAPIASDNARVLILGSMPGQASLDAGQYYAHKRNLFWPIMGELLAFDPLSRYEDRTGALQTAGIALWDVLQSCHREGSLDAKIRPDTLTVNDFAAFFRQHPQIQHVFFNGEKASACFHRYVDKKGLPENLLFQRLPSTSPANASQSLLFKLQAWRQVMTCSSPV